jgi:myosin-crossreactive antigen
MAKDRFDFEQQILNCWRITDDIKQVSEGILDGDLVVDDTANILIGLQHMYELKFNNLWDLFEGVYMADVRKIKMLEEECSALRQQLLEATEMVPVITTKKGKK